MWDEASSAGAGQKEDVRRGAAQRMRAGWARAALTVAAAAAGGGIRPRAEPPCPFEA